MNEHRLLLPNRLHALVLRHHAPLHHGHRLHAHGHVVRMNGVLWDRGHSTAGRGDAARARALQHVHLPCIVVHGQIGHVRMRGCTLLLHDVSWAGCDSTHYVRQSVAALPWSKKAACGAIPNARLLYSCGRHWNTVAVLVGRVPLRVSLRCGTEGMRGQHVGTHRSIQEAVLHVGMVRVVWCPQGSD